jgi:hypothetical protein
VEFGDYVFPSLSAFLFNPFHAMILFLSFEVLTAVMDDVLGCGAV